VVADDERISIWLRPERADRSGPGRRPGYSRAQVTATAVELADSDGLEALTMRRIAAELGTGAMSLYRYVPKRDDLFDLMVDAALAEVVLPAKPAGDWRADLALVARQFRVVGLKHPWLVALITTRPTLGPELLRVYEFSLGALDGLGLEIDELISLTGMLNDYVYGAIRTEIGWLESARRTGLDAEQWRSEYLGPYVQQVIETGNHPLFNRTVLESKLSHLPPEERFEYGLDRVLNGIAASLPKR